MPNDAMRVAACMGGCGQERFGEPFMCGACVEGARLVERNALRLAKEKAAHLERVLAAARLFRKADTGGGFNDRVECGKALDRALADYDEAVRARGEESELYYIQDTRSYCGESVMWWGPNHSGYVISIDEAGLYPEEEARKIERDRSTDRAIPASIVRAAVARHVPAYALRRLLAEKQEGAPDAK